jgi:hypothetical protein
MMADAADAIFKKCSCGRTYTREQWENLPDKKVYTLEWGEVHDQRQCPCGSHIIIVLDPGEPEPAPRERWYRRATGRPIEVVSSTHGCVVYRSGSRMCTATSEEFWATFTKCAVRRSEAR